jgi:hypothetical protein
MKPTSKEVINELSKILDATPKKINGFMGPKEKAIELVAKYYQEFIKDYTVLACFSDEIRNSIYNKRETFAKQCALIAVNQLIEQCWNYREIDLEKSCDYWKEVKQEIEKL